MEAQLDVRRVGAILLGAVLGVALMLSPILAGWYVYSISIFN
jgi:hypothetical protein